jgi:hypothetical protein
MPSGPMVARCPRGWRARNCCSASVKVMLKP